MLKLKTGPNVVINFDPPEIRVSGIDYDSLPSRRQLVQSKLLPFLSPPLPQAPGPGNIITRSLSVNRTDFRQFMTSDDLLFEPPIPPDISIMDWQHHSRLKDLARKYGNAEIARLSAIGHKLLR
jgi:NTE family protein